MCDDRFVNDDAQVVCRQLGLNGGQTHTQAAFGAGTGPIWMDDVRCDGNESRLADCPFKGWGRNNCRHSEDVGVSCGASANMQLNHATLSGAVLTLDYDRMLDDGSVPSTRDFVITARTSIQERVIPIQTVNVIDGDAILHLAKPPVASERVSVTYLPAPMHPLRDVSFNEAPVFSERRVRHIVPMNSSDESCVNITPPISPQSAVSPSQLKIEILDLSNNSRIDLSVLMNAEDLYSLNVSGNQIDDLGSLSGSVDLEELNLHNNDIVDLEPLGSQTNLRVLDLSKNAISNLTPLMNLT